MSGFSNYLVTKTGFLVRQFIRSFNYVAGSAGWTVNKDGSAEFNSVTIRGGEVIDGTALYYSPSPGAGNLVASNGGTAGTDTYGNAYLAGTVGYLKFGGTYYAAQTGGGASADVTTYYTASSEAGPWTAQAGLRTDVHGNLIIDAGLVVNGLADINGSPLVLSGAEVFLPPSGDATGATDSANLATYLGGYAVRLLPGTYYVDAPAVIPSGGSLTGADRGTVLTAAAGFSGAAVVTMPGTTFSELGCLQIDAGGLADGVQLQGAVNPYIHDIDIESPVNGISATGSPITVRARRVTVHQASSIGFSVGATDSTWIDCLALGCGAQGWFIGSGNANSTYIGCRAEFSGTYGFQVSGSWPTGTGSGGPHFIGCSTDRNARSGMFISATGTTPVTITNLACRRDGSSSLTQYAGLEVSAATIPIQVSGLQVFPGVNDGGGGNLSPWSAANISGSPTYVAMADAFLHGATQGLNGSAPYGMASYRNLAVRTGSTSSPSSISLIADSA